MTRTAQLVVIQSPHTHIHFKINEASKLPYTPPRNCMNDYLAIASVDGWP